MMDESRKHIINSSLLFETKRIPISNNDFNKGTKSFLMEIRLGKQNLHPESETYMLLNCTRDFLRRSTNFTFKERFEISVHVRNPSIQFISSNLISIKASKHPNPMTHLAEGT
ncbi:hypothetical protein TNCT_77131 [Trichonephila clavata]|uniref:Uncharacterized protein n=1 Tax=Trichonephila clavata TaxID=2740835 RepID=A0A8X6LRE7_TRICU|nr:hypothetical protein TNCT_77131 [Trichonephila clavata]